MYEQIRDGPITSEDLTKADDVNDTIVRLIWFTKP